MRLYRNDQQLHRTEPKYWLVEPMAVHSISRHRRYLLTGLAGERLSSAKSFIVVERERKCKGKTTIDTHYYLGSLPIDVDLAARSVRHHWHIENQQHWVLGITFKEDSSRIGNRDSTKKIALFRRIVVTVLI